ncbi:MAG: MarR family transcriptional regulator [Clostridiaceae bacterium]|nr:MarR family transcriptional regulator [Clostridiaceae bacterium]
MDQKDKCDRMIKIAMEIDKKLTAIMLKGIEPPLSKSHIYLLAYIRARGECTVTGIANHLEITLSAVTSLVDKLCTAGLVTRLRSDEDRRVVYMNLTEEGKKVLEHIELNKNKLLKVVFSDFDAEEINNFFGTIEKITRNILACYDSENQ